MGMIWVHVGRFDRDRVIYFNPNMHLLVLTLRNALIIISNISIICVCVTGHRSVEYVRIMR